MAVTQLTDVIIPDEFTTCQVENSLVSATLYQGGVVVADGEIASQPQAGAESSIIPFWLDLHDISSGDPNHPVHYENSGLRIRACMFCDR